MAKISLKFHSAVDARFPFRKSPPPPGGWWEATGYAIRCSSFFPPSFRHAAFRLNIRNTSTLYPRYTFYRSLRFLSFEARATFAKVSPWKEWSKRKGKEGWRVILCRSNIRRDDVSSVLVVVQSSFPRASKKLAASFGRRNKGLSRSFSISEASWKLFGVRRESRWLNPTPV